MELSARDLEQKRSEARAHAQRCRVSFLRVSLRFALVVYPKDSRPPIHVKSSVGGNAEIGNFEADRPVRFRRKCRRIPAGAHLAPNVVVPHGQPPCSSVPSLWSSARTVRSRRLISASLGQIGCTSLDVATGRERVRMCAGAAHVDLVIVDVCLPDGCETDMVRQLRASAARSEGALPDRPGQSALRPLLRESAAPTRFSRKPFGLDELTDVVASWLDDALARRHNVSGVVTELVRRFASVIQGRHFRAPCLVASSSSELQPLAQQSRDAAHSSSPSV